MQRRLRNENILVFLALWFLIPLAFVLLIEALKLPERFGNWVG